LEYGLGQEHSRKGLVFCELPRLRAVYEAGTTWTGYLNGLVSKAIRVSPYTGDLISSE